MEFRFELQAVLFGNMERGELTEQETAIYDRQIRVWGVDAQRRYVSYLHAHFFCLFLFLNG